MTGLGARGLQVVEQEMLSCWRRRWSVHRDFSGRRDSSASAQKYPGALFPFGPIRTFHILGYVETLDAFLLQNPQAIVILSLVISPCPHILLSGQVQLLSFVKSPERRLHPFGARIRTCWSVAGSDDGAPCKSPPNEDASGARLKWQGLRSRIEVRCKQWSPGVSDTVHARLIT